MAEIYRMVDTNGPNMRTLRKILSKVDNKPNSLRSGHLEGRSFATNDDISYRPTYYLKYMNGRSLRVDFAFKQLFKHIEYAHRLIRGTYFHQYKFGNTKRSNNIYPFIILSKYDICIQSIYDPMYSNSYNLQRYVYDKYIVTRHNCSSFVSLVYKLGGCGEYFVNNYMLHTRYGLEGENSYEISRKAPLPMYTKRMPFGTVSIYTDLMSKRQKRKSMQLNRLPKRHIKSSNYLYIMGGNDSYR